MAEHNELGKLGEEEACLYLISNGYLLRDRNWRTGHLEIDIVAELYGEMVFVEVKSRSHNDFNEARRAVTLSKKRNLLAAARAYMREKHVDAPYRFDIITVVGEQPPFVVTHYPFAYTRETVWAETTHRKREFGV